MPIYTEIDDAEIWSRIADDHPIINPLSAASVDRLLTSTPLAPGARVLDLGCGRGSWLLRLLELHSEASGVGVDLAPVLVEQAREDAERRGLADRFQGVVSDAAEFSVEEAFDLVLYLGLSNVLGGFDKSLRRLRSAVAPGGYLLMGEAFWQQPPTQGAMNALGVEADDYHELDVLLSKVSAAGWAPVHVYVSTPPEWDDFMWACVRGLTNWGLSDEDPAARAGVLRYMTDYRDGWLRGYRGVLGYVSLVLRPIPDSLRSYTTRRPAGLWP